MKQSLLTFFAVIYSFIILTGQQRVDYDITAELDTTKHTITAEQIISYHNNSDTELNEIYVHLWANAFRSKTTSFADKLLKSGNPDLYFIKSDELGGYTELLFRQNGQILETVPVDNDEEIMIIKLKTPLKSGNSTSISVNYVLKVPKDILGFGFSDNFHILANWYPKVAVYQNNKWEYHSFNSSNLFYSDFGNYSITMIAPTSMTLIASGTEKEFPINTEFKGSLINQNDGFQKKQHIASDICDFAWIVAKNIHKKSVLQVNDVQTKVVTNIYYPIVENNKFYYPIMINSINNSLFFFNRLMNACMPDNLNIIIGDGFKTPSAFQDIITVNHSRFRNHIFSERDLMVRNIAKLNLMNSFSLNSTQTPWMIEGISSYYQTRFLNSDLLDKSKESRDLLTTQKKIKYIYADCLYKTASLNFDEYKNIRQKKFFLDYQTDINLNYLTNRTVTAVFDTTMINFFEKYKNTEVTPEILRSYLDTNLNTDHSWFFDGVMKNRDAFAYRIESVKKDQNLRKAKIFNRSPYAVPYKLSLLDGKSVLESIEVPGHTGMKEFTLENSGGNKIVIDHENTILKSSDSKTLYFIKNRFKNLELLNFYRKTGTTNNVYPIVGYNKNDGFIAGTYFKRFRDKKIKGTIIALYGFGSKSPVGEFEFGYKTSDCCADNFFALGISGATYHRKKSKDFNLRFYRLTPSIAYVFNSKSYRYNVIRYHFDLINDQTFGSKGIESYFRYQNQLTYNNQGGNVILPYSVNVQLEHQYYNYYEKRHYLMINSELNSWYMYKKDRYLKFRLYGATYLYNTHTNSTGTHPGTLSLIGYNINDYSYNDTRFFDRSAQDGFGIRQLITTTGGFKTGISNSYGIGQSNKYVAALNFRIDLPFKTFIKPFFDIGVYGDLPTIAEGYSNKLIYSGGFLIETPFIEIYLPLFNSSVVEDIYNENKSPFWSKFSFSINLNEKGIINEKY